MSKILSLQHHQMNKLVYGCRLCKQGVAHTHEEPSRPLVKQSGLYNKGVFIKPRAIMIEQAIQKLFFPGVEGSICTYRKVKP